MVKIVKQNLLSIVVVSAIRRWSLVRVVKWFIHLVGSDCPTNFRSIVTRTHLSFPTHFPAFGNARFNTERVATGVTVASKHHCDIDGAEHDDDGDDENDDKNTTTVSTGASRRLWMYRVFVITRLWHHWLLRWI